MTGSHGFGSSHRLGQCCLWLAALHCHWIENAEVLLSHHLLLVDVCQVHPRDAFKAFFPPCFGLILTFSCCSYDSLGEEELGTGGSPIQSKRAKWKVFAPDFQATMELIKGPQASRELGEGDIMRLRVTCLLSPIRRGDQRTFSEPFLSQSGNKNWRSAYLILRT